MTQIRTATPDDIDELARLHVQAWKETYPGLLLDDEIAARGLDVRRTQRKNQIAAGRSRIAIAPGLGFAQAGPQRDDPLARRGVTQELYAIYLIHVGQGLGLERSLLAEVTDPNGGPMSALVLDGNAGAIGFYAATGATRWGTRSEAIGAAPIVEHVYVWSDPKALATD